jgi:hypothetical protein
MEEEILQKNFWPEFFFVIFLSLHFKSISMSNHQALSILNIVNGHLSSINIYCQSWILIVINQSLIIFSIIIVMNHRWYSIINHWKFWTNNHRLTIGLYQSFFLPLMINHEPQSVITIVYGSPISLNQLL